MSYYAYAGMFQPDKRIEQITLSELKEIDPSAYTTIISDDSILEAKEIDIDLVKTYRIIIDKIVYDEYYDERMFAVIGRKS